MRNIASCRAFYRALRFYVEKGVGNDENGKKKKNSINVSRGHRDFDRCKRAVFNLPVSPSSAADLPKRKRSHHVNRILFFGAFRDRQRKINDNGDSQRAHELFAD